MITLKETKDYLRIDSDIEDDLITSLIITTETLIEDVLRRKLTEFEVIPEPIHQAELIIVATLYEERQISKEKTGLSIDETLDFIRKMLFSYRKEAF